jgi:hypothetical protein
MPSDTAPATAEPQAETPAQTPAETSGQTAGRTSAEPRPGPLAEARRCLDELDRALRATQARLGGGLDVRRVRTDLVHLRESLALLSASAEEPRAGQAPASAHAPQAMVEVPDTPYDPAMWRDADDEGIGCRHS